MFALSIGRSVTLSRTPPPVAYPPLPSARIWPCVWDLLDELLLLGFRGRLELLDEPVEAPLQRVDLALHQRLVALERLDPQPVGLLGDLLDELLLAGLAGVVDAAGEDQLLLVLRRRLRDVAANLVGEPLGHVLEVHARRVGEHVEVEELLELVRPAAGAAGDVLLCLLRVLGGVLAERGDVDVRDLALPRAGLHGLARALGLLGHVVLEVADEALAPFHHHVPGGALLTEGLRHLLPAAPAPNDAHDSELVDGLLRDGLPLDLVGDLAERGDLRRELLGRLAAFLAGELAGGEDPHAEIALGADLLGELLRGLAGRLDRALDSDFGDGLLDRSGRLLAAVRDRLGEPFRRGPGEALLGRLEQRGRSPRALREAAGDGAGPVEEDEGL
jgi:hypothetical protein